MANEEIPTSQPVNLPVTSKPSNLEVLEAAEELSYISQSLIKDYFYVSQGLMPSIAGTQLKSHLSDIDKHLLMIERVKKPALKDLTEFLKVTRDELKELIQLPFTRDNALLCIDMSEVLLEGSESVAKYVKGKTSVVEYKMLDTIEMQRFYLERMAKLYITSVTGMGDFNTFEQMKLSAEAYDRGLKQLESHQYPSKLRQKIVKLRKRWDTSKPKYLNVKKGDLPKTIFISTESMQRTHKSLIKYHKKDKDNV